MQDIIRNIEIFPFTRLVHACKLLNVRGLALISNSV